MKKNSKIYGDRDSTKKRHSFISSLVPYEKWYIENEKKYKEEIKSIETMNNGQGMNNEYIFFKQKFTFCLQVDLYAKEK